MTYTYESLLEAITVADGREVHNPATGELIGRVPVQSTADVDSSLTFARPNQSRRFNACAGNQCACLVHASKHRVVLGA